MLSGLIKDGFAVGLPRAPGQKEGRFTHLLCGEPQIPDTPSAPVQPPADGANDRELLVRIEALETRLKAIEEKLG